MARQLCHFLNKRDLATAIHVLVTFLIIVMCFIWSCLWKCHRSFCGFKSSSEGRSPLQTSYHPCFTGDPLASYFFPFLIQSAAALLTFKAVHRQGPGNLRDWILHYEPAGPLTTLGESVLLHAPLQSAARLVSTLERSFSVMAPRLQNSLPSEACLVPSLLAVRGWVKKEQFRLTFNAKNLQGF